MSAGSASSCSAVPSPRTPPGADADALRLLPDAACGNDVGGRRDAAGRTRSGELSAWLAVDGAFALVSGAVAFGAADWWSSQFGVQPAALAGGSLASLPYAIGLAAVAANGTSCGRKQSLVVASKFAAVLVAWLAVLTGDGTTTAGTITLALWTSAVLALAAAEWQASIRSVRRPVGEGCLGSTPAG